MAVTPASLEPPDDSCVGSRSAADDGARLPGLPAPPPPDCAAQRSFVRFTCE